MSVPLRGMVSTGSGWQKVGRAAFHVQREVQMGRAQFLLPAAGRMRLQRSGKCVSRVLSRSRALDILPSLASADPVTLTWEVIQRLLEVLETCGAADGPAAGSQSGSGGVG